jgi:streptogramin lyase
MRARQILFALIAAAASTLALSPAASAVRIDEAALDVGGRPPDVAAGPDGNMFVTEQDLNRVVRVRPDGGIIGQFALGAGSSPQGIVAGADGNLWVAEFVARKIAKVTPAGGVTHYPIVGTTTDQPLRIAAGPDGNVWFTEFGASNLIGRMLPNGTLTEFVAGGGVRDIAAGPDGHMWFTSGNTIRRISTSGALQPAFSAGISPGANPNSITLGPDGNMWFTETTAIGRITPAGTVTEFPLAPNDDPSAKIAAGPDGNVWFTQFNDDRVGRITPDGTITLYTQGITANGSPSGLATGPDGRIWFTQFNGHRLGIVTLEPPTAATGGASAIGHDSATVVATVNPLDYATSVRFEYGPTTAYGSSTPAVALPAGSAAVPVTGTLTGLTPQSTVHFRVVATSAIGTTMGSDVTLVTAADPDPDHDGFPAGIDCDNSNPNVHPGAPEIRGNQIDEDCNGRAAPFRRIRSPVRSAFSLFASFTRVTRLTVLRVPARVRIELRCRGAGCFDGVKRIRVRRAKDAVNARRRFLRGRELRPGAVLELRILKRQFIGKVVRYTIRSTSLPRSRVLCLPPGAKRPRRC